MAKNGCDKNCSTCDLGNRTFCSVQLSLKNQELIMQQEKKMDEMEETMKTLIQILSPLLGSSTTPISPNPDGEDNDPVE